MDGRKAAVRANMTVTIDRRAKDEDRVWIDAAWTQESVNDSRHHVGI